MKAYEKKLGPLFDSFKVQLAKKNAGRKTSVRRKLKQPIE